MLCRPPRRFALAALAILLIGTNGTPRADAADPEHPLRTWVKRHPNKETAPKPSPNLGYEGSIAYARDARLLIRHGGHNQGGGGEQNAETWTYDLEQDLWTLKHPNDAPPGVCCAQQNVYHDALARFIRFPAFSYSHGWQSPREVTLKNSSVWTYDLAGNTWRDMRPLPAPAVHPLRGAAYDPRREVIVLHGGEAASHGTVVYDLYSNTWHWMQPENAPPADISQPGFAYDPVHDVFVLFGSQTKDDPKTWLYDLESNTWEAIETMPHPPARANAAVLAADSRNGIVLASLKGQDGLETWAFHAGEKKWSQIAGDQPDDSGARNRVLAYLPDINQFALENRTREQQLWTFRYAEAPEPVAAPQDLKIDVDGKARTARLTWSLRQRESVPLVVYRAEGAVSWKLKWRKIAENVTGDSYDVAELPAGKITWFRVGLAGAKPGEGLSRIVRTQPPVVVEAVVSVVDPKKIELAWKPPEGARVAGYHVERADVAVLSADQDKQVKEPYRPTTDLAIGRITQIGEFRRLTADPLTAPRFTDAEVDLEAGTKPAIEKTVYDSEPGERGIDPEGKPYRYTVYAYRIRAVGPLGVESGPSPVFFSIPSAVQHVFSREEGRDAAQLRWEKNPEKGLAGYYVYRHDGRWDKDPIVRLTEQPIAETQFVDRASGTVTRRYEVVAVDALGQEGLPSQPVWTRREWASYYVPYVEDWHQ
ncbi:MAG: kelch repeat-containing protein [Planctomycetales bacterium]